MATTVREYSLDYYLLDRMKFCGIERENLEDLVSIVAGSKNKYGIAPFAVTPIGHPCTQWSDSSLFRGNHRAQ